MVRIDGQEFELLTGVPTNSREEWCLNTTGTAPEVVRGKSLEVFWRNGEFFFSGCVSPPLVVDWRAPREADVGCASAILAYRWIDNFEYPRTWRKFEP